MCLEIPGNGPDNCRVKAVRKNLLFTGSPGCGKSTIIEKIVQRIPRPITGFFTREIREKGRRVGFSITTLDGKRGILAHIDVQGRHRVGRYRVNLPDIDAFAVPSLIPENETVVVVVDEIGKMECLSAVFRRVIVEVLDSPNWVVGSIALTGDAFISSIKKRPDTRLITVSELNRDALVEEIPKILLERWSGKTS